MADPAKSFIPVETTRGPNPPSRRPNAASNPESRYWRSFRNSQLSSGLVHAVTHLEFSPSAPHDLAAAVSASVHLYSAPTAGIDGDEPLVPKPFSPLTHFSDVAYSPTFRFDGALLAAGGEAGVVQVFDPNKSRPVLRRLSGHARAVRLVRYPRLADKTHLFSGGDDAVLSYWDAATESRVLTFTSAHKDYIRAGAASPVNPEVFATGSYDHSVKLWDVRIGQEGSAVSGFNHGSPVESVLFLPSGGLIATAGGNSVKIWDVIGGCRLVHSMEGHNKTVTSICIGKIVKKDNGGSIDGESRILSASIDGYLKVFDYASFKVTHSTRYPSMLLSVASSPTGFVRVVGTSNGVIYIGKKKEKKERNEVDNGMALIGAERPKRPLRPTSYRYFHRGQCEKPSEGDYMVKKPAQVKLAEHDKLLKKFRHKDALISTLKGKNPNSVMAVMEELVARKKLLRCVENLDKNELGMLLGFLHRYATMPRYARFLLGLAKKVAQMRSEDIEKSDELKRHIRNLKRMVAEEIKIQSSLQELKGMLCPLIRLAGK